MCYVCVPTFHYNLLSISQVTKHTSCSILFSANSCLLQDHALRKRIEIGSLDASLYKLHVQSIVSTNTCNFVSNTSYNYSANNCNKSLVTLWHARFGHAPLSVLKQLPINVDCLKDSSCELCPLARQTRLPFPLSTT